MPEPEEKNRPKNRFHIDVRSDGAMIDDALWGALLMLVNMLCDKSALGVSAYLEEYDDE